MKRRQLHLTLLLCATLCGFGQRFTHEGTIKAPKESGLCKIALSPEQKKHMRPDLSDLRIFNASGQPVPFIWVNESPLKEQQDFVPYEIVSQTHFKNYSEIIIKNAAKDQISNIAFNINNSDAHKYCSVEGSNDGRQWYSVSALQELSLAYNNSYTNSYKCIYFPLSDYLYFRLRVEDWRSEPLMINSAGHFKNSVIAGKKKEVLFKTDVKEDKARQITSIRLSFENNQQVDRIDIKVKSPRLFLRSAVLYAMRTRAEKRREVQYKEELARFELSSDKPLLFNMPGLIEKELFIEIENKDNPPLVIEELHCLQFAGYLVCDLEAGKNYTLKCGDQQLNKPEYDLASFMSSTPQLLPEATLSELKEIPRPAEPKKEKSFLESKHFVWYCLAAGGIIVLIFSMRLMQDMSKKDG